MTFIDFHKYFVYILRKVVPVCVCVCFFKIQKDFIYSFDGLLTYFFNSF